MTTIKRSPIKIFQLSENISWSSTRSVQEETDFIQTLVKSPSIKNFVVSETSKPFVGGKSSTGFEFWLGAFSNRPLRSMVYLDLKKENSSATVTVRIVAPIIPLIGVVLILSRALWNVIQPGSPLASQVTFARSTWTTKPVTSEIYYLVASACIFAFWIYFKQRNAKEVVRLLELKAGDRWKREN